MLTFANPIVPLYNVYFNCSQSNNKTMCTIYNNVEYTYDFISIMVVYVAPIIFGIIGFFGLIANFLVVVIMARNFDMKFTTNIFFVSLAIAEIVHIACCIPTVIIQFMMDYWQFGDIMCKIVQYLKMVTYCGNVYTLVLLSLDRYLAVVHPIVSKSWRTDKIAKYAIGAAWVVILMLSAPALVVNGENHYIYQYDGLSKNLVSCQVLSQYNETAYRVYIFLMSYIFPFVLICIFYILVLVRLRNNIYAEISVEKRHNKTRITRLVFVVIGVFVVSWFPLQILLFIKSLGMLPITTVTTMMLITSFILAYSNTCINPLIYVYLNKNFHRGFRKLFNRRRSLNN